MQPAITESARAANGSKATPRRFPFERSIGCPANRQFTKGKFKVGSSGGFFHAPGANARRTHSDMLLDARHHRAHAPQIRIPPAPPRIVSVADDVSIGRRFAAEFTLQCHFDCPARSKLETGNLALRVARTKLPILTEGRFCTKHPFHAASTLFHRTGL